MTGSLFYGLLENSRFQYEACIKKKNTTKLGYSQKSATFLGDQCNLKTSKYCCTVESWPTPFANTCTGECFLKEVLMFISSKHRLFPDSLDHVNCLNGESQHFSLKQVIWRQQIRCYIISFRAIKSSELLFWLRRMWMFAGLWLQVFDNHAGSHLSCSWPSDGNPWHLSSVWGNDPNLERVQISPSGHRSPHSEQAGTVLLQNTGGRDNPRSQQRAAVTMETLIVASIQVFPDRPQRQKSLLNTTSF